MYIFVPPLIWAIVSFAIPVVVSRTLDPYKIRISYVATCR